MQKRLKELKNLLKNMRRPNITGRNIRSAVAMILVFITVYTMVMPAIALEKNEASDMEGLDLGVQNLREYACTINVHEHTESCYTDKPVFDDAGEQTGTERVLYCGVADWVVHTHDENCYLNGVLVCDLPEREEHVHTDACYSEEKVLTCDLEEGEDHTHTDECYTEERVLTCGESALHTHTVDCYENGPDGESPVDMGWVTIGSDEDGNQVINGDSNHLICGQLELHAHQHTDVCFVEVENQEAGMNAAEGDAAAEAGQTGDAQDIANTAEGSVRAGGSGDAAAAVENSNNAVAVENGNVVSEQAEEASLQPKKIESEVKEAEADPNQMKDIDVVTDADTKSSKKELNLIRLHNDANANNVNTDTAGIDRNNDSDMNTMAEAGSCTVPVEGASYTLQISYSEESGIPANAVFRAASISESREDYAIFRNRALSAVEDYQTEEDSRVKEVPGLFDLSIFNEDGEEIQPNAPISICIDLGDAIGDDAKAVYAVHFPGTGADTVVNPLAANPLSRAANLIDEKLTGTGTEVIETIEEDGTVQFEAGSLSVYAIVYTVDFVYSVSGKTYSYSMEGGSTIKLSELADVLGILDGVNFEKADDFIAEVDNVMFSNENLLKVTHIKQTLGYIGEEDWVLESLKAFDTEETLTVAMKNGDVMEIQVTDAQYDGKSTRAASDGNVTVTVRKQWKNADGSDITSDLPDNIQFSLWREKQAIEPVTMTLYVSDNNQNNPKLIGEYAFEKGTTAKVSYAFIDNYANHGQGACYWINGIRKEIPQEEIKNNPRGSFEVALPSDGSVVKVIMSWGAWGSENLSSIDASGKMPYNPYEYDEAFNEQMTVSSADNWRKDFPDFPVQDNNYRYKYYVAERSIEGWRSSYRYNDGLTEDGTVTVTNTRPKEITVNKIWKDSDKNEMEWPEGVTVDVRLQRRVGNEPFQNVPGLNWTLTSDNREHTFEVNTLNEYNQPYEYRAVEAQVPGYIPETVSNQDGSFTIINTPVETIGSIPITKNWNGASDWRAEFVLQWVPVYSGELAPNEDYINWENNPTVELTSETSTKEVFGDLNLPKYGVDANGDVFRYCYSLDELSYNATIDGKTVSFNGSDYTGDKYVPVYTHDAGELNESNDDYYISVSNTKGIDGVAKTIKMDVNKTWKPIPENADNAYAEFTVKRYVRQAYREISHLSPEDLLADPVTVTLKDISGKILDTITVPPHMCVNVYMVAAPYTGNTSVTVTGEGLNSTFSNGVSNNKALTWTTPFIFPAADSTLVIAGDLNRVSARLLDTTPGGSATLDNSYSETFRLDNSNNWHVQLELDEEVLGAETETTQHVEYYEYYIEETKYYPSEGYYTHFSPDISKDHRINTDTSINVSNSDVPPFYVKKQWHDNADPDNYPEIRFTLYQGIANGSGVQQGTVFTANDGTKFENIPLNPDNNWTWQCPIALPTKNNSGQPVGYYVVESTSGLKANIFNYSSFKDDGTVKQYGEAISVGSGEKYDITPWDYTNDQNSNRAYTGASGQLPEAWKGGFAGNSGTLNIINRVPKYKQMDIKKKVLKVNESDGSVATIMDEQSLQQDIVLELQLMRRVIYEGNLEGFDKVPTTDAQMNVTGYEDAVFLTDWEEYGEPFMIGFDHNHNPIQSNSNPFPLVKQGGFFWRITNERQEEGLPAYGYYNLNGKMIPVRYRYIPYELAIWSDFNRTPYKEGYEWFKGLQPSAWDGSGSQKPAFRPMLPNHDQDRIKNIQGSDLYVEKDWDGSSDNVAEVYIKLYRSRGMDGEKFDVTQDIALRTDTFGQYGFVDNPEQLSTFANGVIVMKKNSDPIHIHSLPLVYDDDNYNSKPYCYWIEEIGYKDKDGNVYAENNASSGFLPEYDQSNENGEYKNEWSTDPAREKLKLLTVGKNKLRVKNHPTKDLEVAKEWYDENGTKLQGPWNNPNTGKPVAESISFKVRRNDGKYLHFDGKETLNISTGGQRAVIRVKEQDSIEYTVSYVDNSADKADIGSWKTLIHGLQKYSKYGAEYFYSIEELKDENGKPLNSNNQVMANCRTRVSGNVIINEKVDTSLSIEKKFAGEVELTDSQKHKITFNVTGPDGFNKTFTYGLDGATGADGQEETDKYKWTDGKLIIKDINPGEYTVVEKGDGIDTIFSGDTSGKTYTHTRSYQVGEGGETTETAVATVVQGDRTDVVITNTYDEEKTGSLKLKKIVKVDNKDTTGTLADGTYTFTVMSGEGITPAIRKTIEITVTNGAAASAAVDGTEVPLDDERFVEISDLPAGNYMVRETGSSNDKMMLDTGTKTVVVTAGKSGGEIEADGKVTITNNLPMLTINILKVDKETKNGIGGAKFHLKQYDVRYQQEIRDWGEYEVKTDGSLKFDGLPIGYYELAETQSPQGYVKISTNPRFEVKWNSSAKKPEVVYTDNTNGMVTYNAANSTFTVCNEPGTPLPHTGGSGTRLFTILGAILILAAGTLLTRRRHLRKV